MYFEEFIRKITRRILAWQSRLLSFGGKLILVRHALHSMPIYLLSTMNPTTTIIKKIHQIMAIFFCENNGEQRRYWASWDTLCFPIEEGGLGLRSLFDMNKAMMIKLWWKFRTDVGTLWASNKGNKYYEKLHPTFSPSRGGSHVQQSMVEVRDDVEPFIWWQLKA